MTKFGELLLAHAHTAAKAGPAESAVPWLPYRALKQALNRVVEEQAILLSAGERADRADLDQPGLDQLARCVLSPDSSCMPLSARLAACLYSA